MKPYRALSGPPPAPGHHRETNDTGVEFDRQLTPDHATGVVFRCVVWPTGGLSIEDQIQQAAW